MEDIINRYKGKKEDGPVPDGYFDTLPDQVLARIAEEDAQTQLFLDAHRNDEGYPVPEGYFEQLPDAVLAKVAEQPARKLFLQRPWVRVASVAACSGLLLGLGIYIFNTFQEIDGQLDGKVAHKKYTPPAPATTPQTTIDFDKALASTTTAPEDNSLPTTPIVKSTPSTDAVTDQFITENLDENDLDEVDFDILDFYSDDMAASDLWGF